MTAEDFAKLNDMVAFCVKQNIKEIVLSDPAFAWAWKIVKQYVPSNAIKGASNTLIILDVSAFPTSKHGQIFRIWKEVDPNVDLFSASASTMPDIKAVGLDGKSGSWSL